MNFPSITVYGKPNCQGCAATKRQLDNAEVPYTYLDVTEDDSAADAVRALNYRSLPVVAVGDIHWSEYRHDKVKALIQLYRNGVDDISALEDEAKSFLEAQS